MTNRILNLLSFVTAIILIFYTLYCGAISSPDTNSYDKLSDQLIKSNLYYPDLIKNSGYVLFFYSLPIILIAVIKLLFLEHWKLFFIFVNCMALFGIIITYVKIAKLASINNSLIAISFLGFLIFPDFLTWPHYVLTDTIYTFLLILSILLLINYIINPRGILSFIKLLLVVSLLLITRPTSLPVVFVIIFLCMYNQIRLNIILTTLIISILIALTFGLINYYNITESIQIDELKNFSGYIKDGIVIHDRPETFILYDESFSYILKLFFIRFISFFSPVASQFSFKHAIINLLIFLPIAFIILYGEITHAICSLTFNKEFYIIRSVLYCIIIVVSTFHSLTLIDYDWRYRYPVIPLLYLVALLNSKSIKYFRT